MCGEQAKHVAEVNAHALCSRCLTDYIADLVGNRRMKIERDTSRIRNPRASSARSKNRQINTGDIAAVAIE